MGAGGRLARAILQTWWIGGEIAVARLVTSLTTDAVAGAHAVIDRVRRRSSALNGVFWSRGDVCLQGIGHLRGCP